MVEQKNIAPFPDAHANDDEIGAYALLLDRLGIGLLVYSADARLILKNQKASGLIVESDPHWVDDKGYVLTPEDHPLHRAILSGQPVFDRLLSVRLPDGNSSWVSINALPVFSGTGNLRRVILTLTDMEEHGLPETLATHDPLTGLFNQLHVNERLENEIHRARRYGTPFTMAQLDIDLFLPLCADHGQAAGDIVLAGVGKLIRSSLREIDFAGRVGNDEFLLVLPNVSVKNALIGLERLRTRIEVATFTDAELRVTVSGGITEYTGENSDALVERCKSLLVQARDAGRNRYCLDADII